MKLLNLFTAVTLLCGSALACNFEYENDYVAKECGAYERDFKKHFDENRSRYPSCGVFVHYHNTFNNPLHYAEVKIVVTCGRPESRLPEDINGFERHTYIDTQVLQVMKPEVFRELMKYPVYTYVRVYSFEEAMALSSAE